MAELKDQGIERLLLVTQAGTTIDILAVIDKRIEDYLSGDEFAKAIQKIMSQYLEEKTK